MQPTPITGLGLALLVALPILALSAPAGIAQTQPPTSQTNRLSEPPNEADASPSFRLDSRLSPAQPVGFIQRLAAQKQAEEQWRQALAQDPKNAEVYRNLADALAKLNRHRDAEAIYRRAIQLDPTDEASYIAFGEFLQTQMRLYETATLYQQMVDRLPDSAIAYEQLAESLTRVATEDWPTASADIEAAYRQAIKLNPNRLESYYGLGAYLARQNRFAEAMATMREIIRLDPDNDRIYATLAAIPTRNQEPAAAAAIYREGLVAQPNNLDLYVSFANWLLSQDRDAEVEAVYQTALAQMPENKTLRRVYAEYLTAVGRTEAAKAFYQAAIEQNAADGFTTYIRLGDILFQQGQIEAARTAYEEAILLSPDVSTYSRLGDLLAATEGPDATIALYQQAIEKPQVEDKGYFYNQIGKLLQAAGRTDEAIATYRKALSLTDNTSSAEPLAALLLAQQEYEEALSLYERFQFSFSNDAKTLENWQAALSGLGRAQEAETLPQDVQSRMAKDQASLYRRAIAISPESGYFYDLLGDALMQQGKSVEAEVAYQEALRLNYGVFRTRIKLGQSLFNQGKVEQAESVYQQALDNAPQTDRQYFVQDQSQLYQSLGELYEATNRPLLALEFYRSVLDIDPYEISVQKRIAELSTKVVDDEQTTSASTETDLALPKARD